VLQIYLPPSLQPLVDNIRQIDISGQTIGECLENAVSRYHSLENAIFDKEHRVQKGLSLYLQAETVNDLNRPVKDGDKLYIINILVGG
jgi:hypothetical protein